MPGPLPDRVGEHLLGQVDDLGQPDLLALVDVGRPGQGQHEQHGRPGPAQAQGGVERRVRADPLVVGHPATGEVQPSVPRRVPGDVVVGQHPGGRSPDRAGCCPAAVDGRAELGGVPGGADEVEVERRVQLVRAGVGGQPLGGVDPGLGDEGAVTVVRVADLAPAAIDLMHVVPVPERVVRALVRDQDALLVPAEVRERLVLLQRVGHVDPEAVDAAVEPEPQDVLELLDDLGVLPVEVRLLRSEQVQVPVTVRQPGPGRAAEGGVPVGRRKRAARPASRPEDVPCAFGAPRPGREGRLEPPVLVRGVVGHDVDDHPEAELVRLADQVVSVAEGAEQRLDVAVVGDVVPAVGHRRGVERRDPDGVDPEVAQVGQSGPDARQVADAVTVTVGEAADVDLVDDGGAPPGGRGLGAAGGRLVAHPDDPAERRALPGRPPVIRDG